MAKNEQRNVGNDGNVMMWNNFREVQIINYCGSGVLNMGKQKIQIGDIFKDEKCGIVLREKHQTKHFVISSY